MGAIMDIIKRVPIYSPKIIMNEETIPQEYSNPCPFLTPENMGIPRPSPYIYVQIKSL